MKIADIVQTPESYGKTVFATFLGKPVVNSGDIRDIIKQYFKINAESDVEAVQKAIDMLTHRPRTRMVRQLFNDLEMMVKTMRLPIGGEYSGILRHQNESRKNQDQSLTEI